MVPIRSEERNLYEVNPAVRPGVGLAKGIQ
jgi:hypothetical protein